MAWKVGDGVPNKDQETANANHEWIRFFNVPERLAANPKPEFSGVSPRVATNEDCRGSGNGREAGMARPMGFQYPGAVYHVMARGDGGKMVFETDDDRLVFLKWLEETCGSYAL